MSTYFQMGHDTENLIGERDLSEFKGIVLSPINREPEPLKAHIASFRQKGNYDIVFDPQLYLPNSERGCLHNHTYFPDDLDTADSSSDSWWAKLAADLSRCVKEYNVNAVTSPVVLPKAWSDDYFVRCADTSLRLSQELEGSNIRTLTTVMVNFDQMGVQDAALRIASIISEADSSGYYLVVVSEVDPRRELASENELLGVMRLISELEGTGRPVLVSHCSSDMLLFKAAGATHCATGKFFNLRRFTRSRYEEPSKGGRPLAYWFEHSLIALLRGADVLRLQKEGFEHLVGAGASNNYWSDKILEHLRDSPHTAWVKLGWRQYLSWFGKTELSMSEGDAAVLTAGWLKTAEDNWLEIEDKGVLLTEPRNDGKWIRPWRQALSDFSRNR